MNTVLNIILIILLIVNLVTNGYSVAVVAYIYDGKVCPENVIPAIYAIAYGVTLLLTLKLAEFNINLALLIPIVASIVNVVVAKLAIRADYKRNTKPYLQIKF